VAEGLLEIIVGRYERGSTILTSNRRVEVGNKVPGDVPAVSAIGRSGSDNHRRF
jgi:hypothetical protein